MTHFRPFHSRTGVFVLAASATLALAACGPQDGPDAGAKAAPMVTAAPAQSAAPVSADAQAPAAPQDGARPVPAAPALARSRGQAGAATATRAPPAVPSPVTERTALASASRGEVRSIEPIRSRPQGSGVGAVAGGVLGAVVGNQFGHGSGRTAMTAIGAAGGAVAGNNVERNYKTTVTGYRVRVALDNGQSRTFEAPRLDGLHVGDRLRVEAGRLRRL